MLNHLNLKERGQIHKTNPPSHPRSFPNICRDYLKASCTKAKSCKADHPKICENLLDHGLHKPYGCNGKECHDLHPPMCKNSLKHNRCLNTNCTYYHIKGTKRKKKSNQQSDSLVSVTKAQHDGAPTTKPNSNSSIEIEAKSSISEGRGDTF